jgi:hypothetical protein
MNRPANAGAVHEDLIAVLGQRIRVNIRWGTGVPLVLCNGIGAGLEVLDPFVAHLNAQTTVVRFDVPGAGRSPNSLLPYRFPYLAAVLGALLRKAGVVGRAARQTQVDVAGSRGRGVGSAVRPAEPASLPTTSADFDRNRVRWSRQALGAVEDGHAAAVSGSPVAAATPRSCMVDGAHRPNGRRTGSSASC